MQTPVLETNRLILRPFKQEDCRDVFECWTSDPDISKYMFWTCHTDIKQTEEWVLSELEKVPADNWYRFAIVRKVTNELIGTTLIYYEEEVENWEIGYNLGKKYWGHGYITEAVKRMLSFASEDLKLCNIVARVAKENPTSQHVLKKLGFVYEKDIPFPCNDGAVMRDGIQCRLTLDSGFSFDVLTG